MKNLTIFSPNIYLDNFVNSFNKIFWDKNFFIDNSLTKINIKLDSKDILLNIKTIDTDTDTLIDLKKSLSNYYKSLNTKTKTIQNIILQKISKINMVVSITSTLENDINQNIFFELLKITKEINGIILIDSKKLLNYDGRLILDSRGNSDLINNQENLKSKT
ncbi:MAG: hypothetical protein ABF289_13315 [Clostridiales bacterium]